MAKQKKARVAVPKRGLVKTHKHCHRWIIRHITDVDIRAAYEKIYRQDEEDFTNAIATINSISKKEKEFACVR